MRQTPNYKFQQPDYNNVADIEVLNGNFDILDSELKKKAGEAEVNDAIQKLDIENKLNGKVDKEDGKGLSEQNFTQTEKTKLENLPNNTELEDKLRLKIDIEKISNDFNGGTDKVLSAERGKLLNQKCIDFDLLMNNPNARATTTFSSNGNISAVVVVGNDKIEKLTEFRPNGSVVETLTFYNNNSQFKKLEKTTTFSGNTIVEEVRRK